MSRFATSQTMLLARLGLLLTVTTVLAEQPAAVELIVTPAAGPSLRGQLLALDADGVTISADGVERQLALQEVRRLAVLPPPTATGSTLVGLVDGSRLAVDDIEVSAEQTTARLSSGPLPLPPGRLHWIAWPAADKTAATAAQPPAWLGELPADPEGDIVVIRRDESWQFIACAITAVTADEVIVLLEDERIPVSRSKLAGLCWLRGTVTPGSEPEPAAGEILLELAGSSLRCRGVSWSAADESWQVQLTKDPDSQTVMPAGVVAGIDYAFGRRIDLTRRPPAQTTVDPFFGGLADDEQLRSFFTARVVPVAAADEADSRGLLIRPRTEMIWTIPPDSRRFRGSLQPAGPAAIAPTAIVIEVDGAERFREELGGRSHGESTNAIPVEIDLTGGRQLRLLVDFVSRPLDDTPEAASTPLVGGPILLVAPLIER
ncbi:MAG: hypothetical protein RLZZ622_1161 [Planctomycetota bacterium]|jgi:hypothetical protein